jgi:hypothetical protein
VRLSGRIRVLFVIAIYDRDHDAAPFPLVEELFQVGDLLNTGDSLRAPHNRLFVLCFVGQDLE